MSEFGVHTRSKDGRRGQCKACRGAYCTEWREKNIDKARATGRRYAGRNSAKRVSYMRERRTGFTEELFAARLKEQENACAICECDLSTTKPKDIHADHCHATGKPRGILCRHCNSGLGFFNDSTELLARASAYLEKHK